MRPGTSAPTRRSPARRPGGRRHVAAVGADEPGGGAVSSSQVNLSWTASTDNVGVTGYRVERCQGAGCTGFAQVGTPAVASFSDSGLIGELRRYRIGCAVDAAGNVRLHRGGERDDAERRPAGRVGGGVFVRRGVGASVVDVSGNGNTGRCRARRGRRRGVMAARCRSTGRAASSGCRLHPRSGCRER